MVHEWTRETKQGVTELPGPGPIPIQKLPPFRENAGSGDAQNFSGYPHQTGPGYSYGQANMRSSDKLFDFSIFGGLAIALFFVGWGVVSFLQLATGTLYEWAHIEQYLMGSLASMSWLSWLGIDLLASEATLWLIMFVPIVWGGAIAVTLWKVRTGAEWAKRTTQGLLFFLGLFSIFGAYQSSVVVGEFGIFGSFLTSMGYDPMFPAIIAGLSIVAYVIIVGFPFGSWKGVIDIEYLLNKNQNQTGGYIGEYDNDGRF